MKPLCHKIGLLFLFAMLAQGVALAQEKAAHRLRPGDGLAVRWANFPEGNWEGEVDNEGNIALPLAETPLRAVCRTTEELEREINRLYAKILRKPQAEVALTEKNQVAEAPVMVLGAVRTPSRFLLTRRAYLSELITAAGGPNERAGRSVRVVPTASVWQCNDDGTFFKREAENIAALALPLADALKKDTQADLQIHAGDIITVLETDLIYLNGAVANPSALAYTPGLTLSQAVAKAGGVAGAANTARIFRRIGASGNKIELTSDLAAIRRGQAPDSPLYAHDVVIICNTCQGQEIVCQTCLPSQDLLSVINKTPLKVIQ
jgi:protein involved in polysaccharide export with SLBB domain